MPPQVCAKCRASQAAEGDTWCVGCTAWESLGRELTAHWDCPGARRLGNDLVVSATRQLRALRSVTAGLARDSHYSSSAGPGAERRGERIPVPEPPPLPPRSRGHSVAETKTHAKEELRSEEDEEEEEEEEAEEPRKERRRSPVKSPDHRPLRSERPRSPPPPPEDEHAPGTKSIGVRLSGRDRSRDRRGDRKERSERHSDRRHSGEHKPNRRGGRKHKRLARLAEDPLLRVHRAPGRSFWELSAEQPRCLELDQLGR